MGKPRIPTTWRDVPAHLRARVLSSMHQATAGELDTAHEGPPVTVGDYYMAQRLAAKALRAAAKRTKP